MKFRLLFAAAATLFLGGCATYDYTGGQSGGYYRGAPTTQYRYPPGYYSPYRGSPYYGGAGWIGLYDYPVYPVYRGGYYHRPGVYPRPGYRPPSRPPGQWQGHRPPPQRPSRPPESRPPRPSRPPPGNSTPRPPSSTPRQGSPWRNMDRLRTPNQPARPRR